MFDSSLYLAEMKAMVDRSIHRLAIEMPDFKIYTASIWTDPNAAASSINFDSKVNSLKNVAASNKWHKKYYNQYMKEGDLKQAALFKPYKGTRQGNPADFQLRDFETISNESFPKHWEEQSDGKCWKKLQPALTKIGNYTFKKLQKSNLEKGFELSINSEQDWYDKTWH